MSPFQAIYHEERSKRSIVFPHYATLRELEPLPKAKAMPVTNPQRAQAWSKRRDPKWAALIHADCVAGLTITAMVLRHNLSRKTVELIIANHGYARKHYRERGVYAHRNMTTAERAIHGDAIRQARRRKS